MAFTIKVISIRQKNVILSKAEKNNIKTSIEYNLSGSTIITIECTKDRWKELG